MLEDTRRNFESCFPNMELKVELEVNKDNIPVKLTIIKYTQPFRFRATALNPKA